MNKIKIENLEKCIDILTITANCCYSAFEKKDQKGRNLLLNSKDKIYKLILDEEKKEVKNANR